MKGTGFPLQTQLYFRALFILLLSPLPQGVRGRVRIASFFLRRPFFFCRFRPGSGGKSVLFVFGLERSWANGTTQNNFQQGTRTSCRPVLGHRVASLCMPLMTTLCYAVMLPGRKSGLRAGLRPDSSRESLKIGSPAGRRADFEAFPMCSRTGGEARVLEN